MNSWLGRLGPAVVLGVVVCSGALSSGPSPQGLCMTVLDVGQGDSILVEFPSGDPWLVDGGGAPGSRFDVGVHRVLPALRERGIDRLALVVMTHGDADHVGGLFAVLEQIAVGALLVPSRRTLGSAERSLLNLADQRGVPILVADEGDAPPAVSEGARAEILHPLGRAGRDVSSNDGSVVLRVGLGAVWMLLTGDLEAPGERLLGASGTDLSAQVLKVGHHGSRTSTTQEFLDVVDPLVAVTGAGAGNRFGFPHAAVSARLRTQGAPLLWTGRDGEVRTCTDGARIDVHTRPDGRWVSRGEHDPETVQGWVAQDAERGERRARWAASVTASWTEEADHAGRAGPRRSKKSRGKKAKRKGATTSRTRKRSRAKKEPATPAPPTLMNEREWRRSRQDRRRPKPPWRSRR